MMKNFNGTILKEPLLRFENRAFSYGDALFDTLKVTEGRIYFLEAHYFRLMASIRILRMEIPSFFTLEFYEQEILKSIDAAALQGTVRVRVTVFRSGGGLYRPELHAIDYLIEASPYEAVSYATYAVDIFKDYSISSSFLSTVKTTNRIHNVLASIYAEENALHNCILLNEKKQLVEVINGNLFIVKGQTIITPPLAEGCINGIVRKKILELTAKSTAFEVQEAPLLLTDLLQCDEVFITNSLTGIQSVTHFRKKHYATALTQQLQHAFDGLI